MIKPILGKMKERTLLCCCTIWFIVFLVVAGIFGGLFAGFPFLLEKFVEKVRNDQCALYREYYFLKFCSKWQSCPGQHRQRTGSLLQFRCLLLSRFGMLLIQKKSQVVPSQILQQLDHFITSRFLHYIRVYVCTLN